MLTKKYYNQSLDRKCPMTIKCFSKKVINVKRLKSQKKKCGKKEKVGQKKNVLKKHINLSSFYVMFKGNKKKYLTQV